MTPEEIVDLYEATYPVPVPAHGTPLGPRPGLRNVFVLGSLCERRELVAVSVQQIRAINLIESLCSTGRLAAGARICVVGAGAAGLTAAAYAIVKGLEVTVLESREPLWNLRGCRTRWLHPNLYARWPEPGWQVSATNLPVMNWYADYACNVGDLLWRKFESYQRDPKTIRYIHEFQFERHEGAWSVHWLPASDEPSETADFDAIVLAVGFGSETAYRDATASVYWLDDVLEREDPHHGLGTDAHQDRKVFLVSGTGDGGLTDLLRIRLREFRHHHLRDLLLDIAALDGAGPDGEEPDSAAPRTSVVPEIIDLDARAVQLRDRIWAAWHGLPIAVQGDVAAVGRRDKWLADVDDWISGAFREVVKRLPFADGTCQRV